MSACIYHDAEAVAVCPSCDFGVCQQCMDDGSDGVCGTCAEERDMRRQHSALQREFTVEEQVPRCNYCRAAEDEETPLDEHGYCPTCTTLARCCLHDDLIAVGHCKSCRKEYCRKCLGFTDVCQSCTAKNKAKPPKPAPPPAAGARPAKKKAAGTTPIKEGTGKVKEGTARMKDGTGKVGTGKVKEGTGSTRKKGESAPLESKGEGKKKGTVQLDENGKPKKRPPSRGTLAMEAKLAAKAPPRRRIMIAVPVVAVLLVCLLGGWLHAASPEDEVRHLQEQMITVHRAVIQHYHKYGKLPASPLELQHSLMALDPRAAKSIHVVVAKGAVNHAAPNTVIYQPSGMTFVITVAGASGGVVTDSRGTPIFLDQTYDSSAGQ